MAAKRRVFDSVFQIAGAMSQPTPVVDFTASGQAFGGPTPFTHDRTQAPDSLTRSFRVSLEPPTDARDQINWDLSWHTTTTFLTLFFSSAGLSLEGSRLDQPVPSPAFHSALKDVLDSSSRLPGASQTEDLIGWYSQQVRYHFLHEVCAMLSRASETPNPEEVFPAYISILEQAHFLYLNGLSFIVRELDESKPGTSPSITLRFRHDLHALVTNSISLRFTESLAALLSYKVSVVVGLPSREDTSQSSVGNQTVSSVSEKDQARRQLLGLIESLRNVGLGGEKLKILFAEVMNDTMSKYVLRQYSKVWSGSASKGDVNQGGDEDLQGNSTTTRGASDQFFILKSFGRTPLVPRAVNGASLSRCVKDLCEWVEGDYSSLVLDVLRKLDEADLNWTHVERWGKMGIGRLAALRTQELFDIVENWPNSDGALDDLRTAIDTPQRRLQLTDVFSASLKERLLHPGTSTLQILRTYISMIWSFHSLDHSKVLLDRVAYPLQVYLYSREDTVKIIIAGLLSETEDAPGAPIGSGGEKLTELAILLDKGSEQLGRRADEDLDWNDMDWVPDPVDAGPGYKRSKNADVIGTLIGVLGSQDVFIKEFQNVIGENLIKSDGDFEKELKLLELLKTRFGEAPLQSCEVMIKDIQDSRRVDGVIRRNQKLDPSNEEIAAARATSGVAQEEHTSPEGLLKPSLHARILSRLFWPQLQGENYRVPQDIVSLQQRYEKGFEQLKNSRKLTWLHGLGQATVELELEDRVILEEVHTWQATVVWAFQSNEDDDDQVTRSVAELVENLEMDEALVRSALSFWAQKMVLREIRKDEYAVLETLNQEDRARSDAQAGVPGTAAMESSADDTALMSNETLASEKMQMYWQFIQGMLTNSSPQMPLQQIAMMLKMLIVDGFPYSNEELQEFLGRKVAAGELELFKGKYKLKK